MERVCGAVWDALNNCDARRWVLCRDCRGAWHAVGCGSHRIGLKEIAKRELSGGIAVGHNHTRRAKLAHVEDWVCRVDIVCHNGRCRELERIRGIYAPRNEIISSRVEVKHEQIRADGKAPRPRTRRRKLSVSNERCARVLVNDRGAHATTRVFPRVYRCSSHVGRINVELLIRVCDDVTRLHARGGHAALGCPGLRSRRVGIQRP